MFVLKKIITSFLMPAGIFVLILFSFSIYFLLKKRKRYFFLFAFISFFIWIFSSNFWVNYLTCREERKIKVCYDGDVIVFLSGGNNSVFDPVTNSNYLSESSSERLFAVYRLHKKTGLPVILTGGVVGNMESDSKIAYQILKFLGVDEKKIFIEDKSRDTYENAIFSKEISDINGFKKPVIVSNSLHLKRAEILFKKAGFNELCLYPSSFFCRKMSFIDFLPSDFHFHRKYLHEKLGIIYYKIFY